MEHDLTPERWERIQALYHAARMLPEGDRRRFLADSCAGDSALEREVQKLLDQPVSTGSFMEFVGDAAPAQPVSATRQDLTGQQLGGYRVTSLLGRGGMGEVYRAHDSRLGRDVALKVLPAEFTADAGRLARFESEARMLAALNHPHIGAIFGVEDAAGFPALVLELVDGETLAERVRRGPVAMRDALKIAGQIADALDAAHRKGIVHRDLKPANIKVTADGIVKVLDFGLAKAAGKGLVSGQEHSQTTTHGVDVTSVGTLLGTAPYMSPEQARGLPVDTRTDIWAFGCVLYEMLTGERAFRGETITETLTAILEREPDWNRLPSATPPRIRRLLRDCLQRDLAHRLQNIADVRDTIDVIQRGWNRWRAAAIAAAVVTVLVTGGGVLLFRSASRSGPIASSADYVQLTDLAESAVTPSLSPDGRMVTFKVGEDFFFGRGRIYVRPLPNGESVPLTPSGVGMYGPVFNHDGTRVAYTRTVEGWDTFAVPVLGGEPARLLANASGLTYLSKDRVLFAEIRGALHMGIVSATEQRSDLRDVYFPPHELGMAHFAYASPDRQWILVVEMDQTHAFGLPCRLVPADGSSPGREVGPRGTCTSAAWSPDGQWMYFAAAVGGRSHLWRQRFPDGTPEQVTTGRQSLITALGIRRSSIWIHDAAGDRAIVAEGFAQLPRLSRDGTRVFFLLRPSAESDSFELRSLTLATGAVQTLIQGVPIIQYDISPDESEIAFTTSEDRASQIWVAPLDRRRPPTRIASEADQVSFGAGDELVYRSIQPSGNRVIRASKDGARRVELEGPPVHEKGEVSPDGRWVIVYSQGSGGAMEPVSTFAVPVRGGAARRVCIPYCNVGWSADGRFFSVGVQLNLATGAPARTLVVPLAEPSSLPELPEQGVHAIFEYSALAKRPDVHALQLGGVSIASDPTTYVYTKADFHTNLFLIPLRR
ncbi:MAG: serine/threonine-protein kinase [Acidobacteria bacterium]|nr:serine/threonine-protein kinase [Acidobacteriota bacterium]